MKVRVSDLVNLLYPEDAILRKSQRKYIDKKLLFGKLAHQDIQAQMKRKNHMLLPEFSGIFTYGNHEISYHIDLFDPIQRTLYEIKSDFRLSKHLDKVKAQSDMYAYLTKATKIKLIKYKLVYDVFEEYEANWDRGAYLIETALSKLPQNYKIQDGNAIEDSEYMVTNTEVRTMLDSFLRCDNLQDLKQKILDYYIELL